MNQSILRLEGVNDRDAASWYFGKRVVYIYKTTSGQKDKRFRVSLSFIVDHLGKNQQSPRKQRSSTRQIQTQPPTQSHRIHPQSHVVPPKGLISSSCDFIKSTYLNSIIQYQYPIKCYSADP